MRDRKIVELFQEKEAKICVIGLGYVGLSLAITCAKKGFKTIGLEVDENKVNSLREGTSYLVDIDDANIKEMMQQTLSVTSDYSQLADVDVIVICLPTPINQEQQPDLTYVQGAMTSLLPYVKPNTLLVLESTTYPGTTKEHLVKPLQQQGFIVGEDVFVAYSPERVDPGNANFATANTPKLVGGYSEACRNVAQAFYQQVIAAPIHLVTSPQIAEMAKLLENVFRNVNIALANEMAMICNDMKIDTWEVIEAASTKPYGFMPFYPGPGIGGHCIPVDPVYLVWKAKQYTNQTSFIEKAMAVNEAMGGYVIERMNNLLQREGLTLTTATIVFVGAAYKRNSNDYRETPLFPILSHCDTYTVIDTYIPSFNYQGQLVKTQPLTAELIQQADLVVIVTDHDNFDYAVVDQHARAIFDTRNVDYPFQNKHYSKL